MREFAHSRLAFVLFLFLGLLIFSGALIYCAIRLPNNERIYLFLAGVAGNFSGALFATMHVERPGKP